MAKGRRRSSAVRRVRPVAVRASPVENATFGDETGGAACADGLAGISCSIVGRRLRRACRVRRQSPAAVFSGLSARDAWPAMRTRAHGAACSRPAGAASSVRGGSRDAGVAGARGIRAMLERRAPVRLRRRRPIVPPRSTKRTACRASAARRASSPAFRRARAAVALSPLSSTLSSLVR